MPEPRPEPKSDAANSVDMGSARTVWLPRFLVPEPMGLGQVVKRATSAAGVKPCGGCVRRAARLNQWLRFEPRG
jgi:hypothetical protein